MRTIDCTDIKAMLSALVDDRVDEETRYAAERHMAECTACRRLLDEAEAADALVGAELESLIGPLSNEFEDAVLRRTVHMQSPHLRFRSWVTWLGWVAAAAAVVLAATIWALDRQVIWRGAAPSAVSSPPGGYAMTPREQAPRHTASARIGYYEPRPFERSWTGNPPADFYHTSSGAAPGERTAAAGPSTEGPGAMRPAEGGEADAARQPVMEEPAPARPIVAPVSRADADTLSAAALLMDTLAHSELSSFAEAEQIRQVAEYDDLLARLAEARSHLPEMDRAAVFATESILMRMVLGPLSMEDLRLLRNGVIRMNLAARLQSLSDRWSPPESA